MSLYLIQHDGQGDYVEANGIGNAEQVWRAHVRSEPDNADFNEEPDSIALLSTDAVIRQDQPCQKTNANAGTGGDHTMASSESLTVSHRERGATSATAKSGDQSAPPSEPNLVQTARELARFGMNAAAETNQACVAYIDTLSARLKRAEELLQEIFDYRSIQIGREIGWKITAFLAGKGEA